MNQWERILKSRAANEARMWKSKVVRAYGRLSKRAAGESLVKWGRIKKNEAGEANEDDENKEAEEFEQNEEEYIKEAEKHEEELSNENDEDSSDSDFMY